MNCTCYRVDEWVVCIIKGAAKLKFKKTFLSSAPKISFNPRMTSLMTNSDRGT